MTHDILWPEIPIEIIDTLTNILKDDTKSWLKENTNLANHLAFKWGIDLERVLIGGALSLCIYGRLKDGDEVVLKIPTKVSTGNLEKHALTIWDGKRTPKVIHDHHESGSFLMTYIKNEIHSPTAKEIVSLSNDLHKPIFEDKFIENLKTNVDMRIAWALERFSSDKYKKEYKDLKKAIDLMDDLMRKEEKNYLLHGDFQNKNLLYDGRKIMTLDPLPVIGSIYFDLAFWAALTSEGLDMMTLSRIISEEAKLDPDEFLKWTWSIAVIENRPYQNIGAKRRQLFIDQVF